VDDNWDACNRSVSIRNGQYIAFSHKGNLVATCGGDGDVSFLVIIEAATGIILSTFNSHKDTVRCVAFSPDDSLLVSGSKDWMVNLWDVQTGGLARSVKMIGDVLSVGFSHDGTMVACNFGIWDSALEELVHNLEPGVMDLAWSPNSADVILGYDSGYLKILDTTRGTYRKNPSAHQYPIQSVAYSRDGSKIASGSPDSIKVHDAKTGNVLHEYPTDYYDFICLTFSCDGDRLVIGHDLSLIIRDLAASVNVTVFQQPETIYSVSVSPDGMSIGLAASDKLSIWQMDGPIQSSSAATSWHSDMVFCIAISPDSTFVASGSYDNTVKLWDSATSACIHTFDDHSRFVLSVAVSPDSSLVASGSLDRTIRVWRVADRSLVCTLRGHTSGVLGVNFSPDGRRIASVAGDGELMLGEIEGEAMLGILRATALDRYYPTIIRFSDIGTGITVSSKVETRSWEIVPRTVFSLDVNPDELSITFIPQDHPFQHPSLALYKYDVNSEWITDQYNRRVLWLPADLRSRRSCCQGSQVAIGTASGRVFWFDFGLSSSD
jgi:WD40 repeat protein